MFVYIDVPGIPVLLPSITSRAAMPSGGRPVFGPRTPRGYGKVEFLKGYAKHFLKH